MDIEPTILILFAFSFSALVSVSLLLTCVLPSIPLTRPLPQDLSRLVRYGWPLVGNGVLGWIGSAGDRYIIAAAIGFQATGIYVAASAIGGRLSGIIGGLVEVYLRPRLYSAVVQQRGDNLLSVCRQWLWWVCATGLGLLFCVFAFMPLITEYLLPPQFRQDAPVVILLSFAAYFLVSVAVLPQRINYAYERTGRVTAVESIGVMAMFPAVFVLGKLLGLAGAALGLVVMASIRLLVSRHLAYRTMKENGVI